MKRSASNLYYQNHLKHKSYVQWRHLLPVYQSRYYFIQKTRDNTFSRKKNQYKFSIISGMMKAKKKEAEVEKRITLSIAPRGKKKAVTVVQV